MPPFAQRVGLRSWPIVVSTAFETRNLSTCTTHVCGSSAVPISVCSSSSGGCGLSEKPAPLLEILTFAMPMWAGPSPASRFVDRGSTRECGVRNDFDRLLRAVRIDIPALRAVERLLADCATGFLSRRCRCFPANVEEHVDGAFGLWGRRVGEDEHIARIGRMADELVLDPRGPEIG